MRAEKVMDFGMQMAAAARLAATFPQVGEQLRERYRVVLLDEYQDTGHAQRVALSALFGGGVDDGLAVTAVGDPIQSIYGWRGASATNLPRFTTDFPLPDGTPRPTLELRTSWRNPPRRCTWPTRCRPRRGAGRWRCATLRPRPGAAAGHGPVRAADRRRRRTGLGRRPHRRGATTGARRRGTRRADGRGAGAPQRRRRTDRRGADAPAACRSRWSAWPGCWPCPRSPTWSRCCGWSPTRPPAPRPCGCSPGRAGGSAPRDLAALWRRAVELDDRPVGATARPPSRSSRRPAPDADAACLADAICRSRAGRSATRRRAIARIAALGRELTALRAPPGPPAARPGRRGAAGARRRRRGPRGPAGAGGLAGTEHLDAFADVVADFAARGPARRVPALLAYLDAAEEVENGLAPGEVDGRRTTACRSSPCTPPRAWSGRWWPCRT